MREHIVGLLASTPTIEHFPIGWEAITERGVARASSRLPRPRRAAFRRTQMRYWRRQVDELRANARSAEAVLTALSQLPYGGLPYADSAEEAERIMTATAQSMEGCSVVGIHAEVVSPAVAAIWLWRDA